MLKLEVVRFYDFTERKHFSEGYLTGSIDTIIKSHIPCCVAVEKAAFEADINGTDYWARRAYLPPLSIDVKIRDKDWLAYKGDDDLALETWSVLHKKVGWARDTKKRTDYILWYWQDTGRFFLVPFPPLCSLFNAHWLEWSKQFRVARQRSHSWFSECVFIPRHLIINKLIKWMESNTEQ